MKLFFKKRKRDIDKLFKSLEKKKNMFYKHKFQKYIVSYELIGDQVKVYSNIGNYRMIKNTRSNMNKINRAIVKNKIDIINKIDDYEKSFKERLIVLLVNLLLVIVSGSLIPFSFFTGNIVLLMLACLTFSITTVTSCVSGFDYYILASEIQNLKSITGYKKENEFKLPSINLLNINK